MPYRHPGNTAAVNIPFKSKPKNKNVPKVKKADTVCKNLKLKLHQLLDEQEITELHDLFDEEEGKRMKKQRLYDVFREFALKYDKKAFDTIFKQMNSSCDGYVTWNEFISYLILGFQEQEISMEFKTLDFPIPCSPIMLKSNHRHRVSRIAFYPTVKLDRTCNWYDGSIITCSRDGVVNYWSLDMQLERSAQSTCPLLRVQTTWITDMAVLPDVSVICTSSTERDLRFYDTSARKFELRVMITTLPEAVTAMSYKFDTDINVPSKLILGDMGGNIRVMSFKSEARGPFKSQPGIPLLHVRYDAALKGAVANFSVQEFPNIHSDYIRQVSYYSSLHCVASCAQCPKAFMMTEETDSNQKKYIYKIVAGAWCFALEESAHIVATGGPDCLVRIWNPFVPRRATCTFYGHHTGVVQMTFQDNGKILYSLSKDKCIKVWDIGMQSLLQTYLELPPQLGDTSGITTLYNPESRQWIIGGNMIAILPLSPKPSSEHTDGNTHVSGVSVVLYNKLYKKLVTCGLDSFIIVWDPFDGRRLLIIREAHTVLVHGAIQPVEITAATFDPGYQRLLTGAHDGTLKVWSFNSGTCLRNMQTQKWCEIKSVIWVKNRIMATGWNRRITEFADTGEAIGPEGAYSKNWDLRHTEDISSAAVRVPETLATSSYAGELILWRLETGQPYKKFNVSNPTTRIKIHYQLTKTKEKNVKEELIHHKRKSVAGPGLLYKEKKHPAGRKLQGKFRRVSTVAVPEEVFHLRKLSVHCMLFLNARKSDPEVGTLLVALENGVIQVWNHHIQGSFITSFSAIHKAGDYVISMTTDDKNEFLFTGTTVGYIKTWLLKNYCVSPADEEHICMPKYRLMFPFMWGNIFVGRAARMVADQPKPILLNSFKGHFMPVSGLTYINECKIVISCSADFSVRMWTIGGRYLQTIGTFKPWKRIFPNKSVSSSFAFTIPPDIKKVASSTTLRVLSGGYFERKLTVKQLERRAQKNLVQVDKTKIYGKPLEPPLLGNYYTLPERTAKPKEIIFDMTFPYIPVYQHLIMPNLMPIEKAADVELKQIIYSSIEIANTKKS